jgi:hypothetical protein
VLPPADGTAAEAAGSGAGEKVLGKFSGKKTKAGFYAVKQPSTGNHRGPCQCLLARLNGCIRTHKHRVPHRSEVSFIQ